MLIVIIADIHDNLVNLTKCLNWCKENKIKKMICCGDITNEDTLNYLSNNFVGEIHLVKGNVELYRTKHLAELKNIHYYGQIGYLKLNGKTLGFCHEPFLIDKVLARKCDLVFYGHTHKPWLENFDDIKTVNSGDLSGTWHKATFAIYDSNKDKLELKLLENI